VPVLKRSSIITTAMCALIFTWGRLSTSTIIPTIITAAIIKASSQTRITSLAAAILSSRPRISGGIGTLASLAPNTLGRIYCNLSRCNGPAFGPALKTLRLK
jgi:hypothetical protein